MTSSSDSSTPSESSSDCVGSPTPTSSDESMNSRQTPQSRSSPVAQMPPHNARPSSPERDRRRSGPQHHHHPAGRLAPELPEDQSTSGSQPRRRQWPRRNLGSESRE